MQKRVAVLTAVALMTGSAATARAQAAFGVIGGVGRATLTGGGSQGVTWRTTFLAGGVGVMPLTETLAIRPELYLATKGARARLGRTADAALKLSYLEVPIFLQVNTGPGRPLQAHLFGGMSVALILGCSRDGVDCDTDPAFTDHVFHTFDSNLVMGGEVEAFGAALGVRYGVGLSTVRASPSGLELVNGVLSFTIRYMIRP